MRVLTITNNLQQASFRLRIEALEPLLRDRGIELEIKVRPRGLLARRMLFSGAGKYDAVILQRKLLDPGDARLLKRRAKRVIFDVDDAVMYCQGKASAFSRWRTWRRFCATAANVDAVVAGNEYLADLFRRQGAKVSVLPTLADMEHYQVKQYAQVARPALVWIGSRSTLGYLKECLPFIESAGLKLIVIADESVKSQKIEIEHVPWSADTEAAALCRGDIGIAPTPDDQWTQGKCGFKIVQYMAAGLAVIATPVGANAELVVEGETGFLARSLEDWPRLIRQLAGDASLRARMGVAARTRAEKMYSLQRGADFWAKILHSS